MALYCSINDLKSQMRLGGAGGRTDLDLNNFLTTASRWLDRHFNLVDDAFLATATASRRYDGTWKKGSVLRLDMPLVDLTTVTNGSGSSVSLGNIWLMPRNALPATSLRLTTGTWVASYTQEIVVAGVWGYSTAVPDEIREATAVLAVWMANEYQTRRAVDGKTFDKPGDEVDTQDTPALLHTLLAPIASHLRRLRHL